MEDTADAAAPPPPRKKDEILQSRRRLGLLVFSGAYTFLYVGAFLGYGPMQLALEQNGSFASKCTADEQARGEICPAQTSALVNVQFFALVSQVTAPILGQIGDHYGPKVLLYIMSGTVWTALSLFVVAAEGVDLLLYPTFILLGLVTWMGAVLVVNTGLLFPGHLMSRVILVLNSLFDAGSVTYLGLQAMGEGTGISLTQIVGGYLALSVVIFGGACYFWTVVQPVDALDTTTTTIPATPAETQRGESVEPFSSGESAAAESDPPTSSRITEPATSGNEREDACVTGQQPSDGPTSDERAAENVVATTADGEENTVESEKLLVSSYVLVSERTLWKQLTSRPFMLVALFFTIHTTSQQWSMTTTRDFLAFLGDDELDNKYLGIFTLLLPASLLATPFTDVMLKYTGFHGGLQMVNALALGYFIVRLCSDNLNVQVFGFIIFSFYRNFLYGLTFAILPVILAPNVIGKGIGALMAVSGVTTYMNVPLSKFAIEEQDGDFFIPNLIYALSILPCIGIVTCIGRAMQRENDEQLRKTTALGDSSHQKAL
jgi:hypothetical protein